MSKKRAFNGQDVNNTGDYYALLEQIRAKPGLYIGVPSISNLFMFLKGYHFARHQLNIPMSAEAREFQEFQPWLQKKMGLQTSHSWSQLILFYASDERDAFERFFEFLYEFLQSRRTPLSADPVENELELA